MRERERERALEKGRAWDRELILDCTCAGNSSQDGDGDPMAVAAFKPIGFAFSSASGAVLMKSARSSSLALPSPVTSVSCIFTMPVISPLVGSVFKGILNYQRFSCMYYHDIFHRSLHSPHQ